MPYGAVCHQTLCKPYDSVCYFTFTPETSVHKITYFVINVMLDVNSINQLLSLIIIYKAVGLEPHRIVAKYSVKYLSPDEFFCIKILQNSILAQPDWGSSQCSPRPLVSWGGGSPFLFPLQMFWYCGCNKSCYSKLTLLY